MGYRSAVFDGVREILRMAAEKNPQLVAWFAGITGVPVSSEGFDSIHALNDFTQHSLSRLRRGSVRAEDVATVNEMVFIQLKSRTGLSEYDTRTGILWEWDGNPVVHVAAGGFCVQAARLLDDTALLERCLAVQTNALERVEEMLTPGGEPLAWSVHARERAACLKRHVDVSSALSALETELDSKMQSFG